MRWFFVFLAFLLCQHAYGALYELREVVKVLPQPNAKVVEIWIPVPYENRWQKIKGLNVFSPFPFKLLEEKEYGNRFIYVKTGAVKKVQKITVKVLVERKEVSPSKWSSKVPVRYLLSDRLVPVEKFKKFAENLVRGKKTDVEKLKAVYNYVVSHMKYLKKGKGWGRGDAVWACNAKHGNCTDFHSLFIALSRALNIPALFEIGIPVNGNGKVNGYHCWVLAFPKGYVFGIDASEAAKHPEKRNYFFGHLDVHRIGITRGRDVLLSPPQHGPRLNFIYKAYEEVDLKPSREISTEFYVKKLK
jgi:transglutaminase-like putative cysteine protease